MTHRESRCILTRPISHRAFPLGPWPGCRSGFPAKFFWGRQYWLGMWQPSRELLPMDSGLLFPLEAWSILRQIDPDRDLPPTLWQPTLAQTRFKWRELEGPDFVGNDIIPTRNVKKDPLSPHSEKSCCLKLKRNLNALRSLRWFARKSVIFWDSLVVRWIPFCLLPGLLALAGNHQSVSKQQKVSWSAFVL